MIPNVFHFIFGLLPEPHFGFLEYLAIRSAHEINHPARIFLHHQYECTGPWWEKTKELVTLNRVECGLRSSDGGSTTSRIVATCCG